MLTLTAQQHLARLGERLASGKWEEAEYNDIAVIAMYYHMHAKEKQDRIDAAVLCDMAVQMRAYWYPFQQSKGTV